MSSKGAKPHLTMLEYQQLRLQQMVTDQRKLYPFAFNLIDSPNDDQEDEMFAEYWAIEVKIQSCRNEILKLKGI